MKDQSILRTRGRAHALAVRGVFALALGLLAVIGFHAVFNAEARMRRATRRLVTEVRKDGDESPVGLGLSAGRLGKQLAVGVLLELNDRGTIAASRKEVVQLYVQVRSRLARIEINEPQIVSRSPRRGEVRVSVRAPYRLVGDSGEVESGDGRAELVWIKGDGGWLVNQARLHVEEGARLPLSW